MQPIDHLQASSIHLKAHSYYYQFSLSKTTRLPPFSGYYGRPTRSAKSFSRTGPIEVSSADVPAPLPDKEHTVLPTQNTARVAGRTTSPHRLCSSATPILAPTHVEFSSFGEAPPPPHNHPSPFDRTGELRRALKNRLTQFSNLVYCDLTSVEYKRGKP